MPGSSTLSTNFQDGIVPPALLFHFTWDFLDIDSRVLVCRSYWIMSSYARLRSRAAIMTRDDFAQLTAPLSPHDAKERDLDMTRVEDLAPWFLLSDFDPGLFTRSLGGHYTGDFSQFDAIDEAISSLHTIPHNEEEPPINFENASHLLHHGFPRIGHFTCDRNDTLARNLYDNHSSIEEHKSLIEDKIRIDVNKSYAIALPRWLLHFVLGLFITPLGIVFRKSKSRMTCDPSTRVLGKDDTGALNDYMSIKDPDQVPPVNYGTALRRCWNRLWSLRISSPNEPIGVYKDDLVSAFRRIRYAPDIIAAFCYVFDTLFILPIGGLFGPRNTPGWFSNISDLRAFASQHLSSLHKASPSIIDSVKFIAPEGEISPALADSRFRGTLAIARGPQPCFVDDTIIIELMSNIKQAAAASVRSAVLFFGDPLGIVEQPISVEKFMRSFQTSCDVLGFDLHAQELAVSYSLEKRAELRAKLADLHYTARGTTSAQIRDIASILGKIHHLAQILPLGPTISFRLQLLLTATLRHRTPSAIKSFSDISRAIKQVWDSNRPVFIPTNIAKELKFLGNLLASDAKYIWYRPLGLLVNRLPDSVTFTDACGLAMGGLDEKLQFMWYISVQDLLGTSIPPQHINILEFIGMIINIFFEILALKNINSWAPLGLLPSAGALIRARTDNTSALGWFRHSARSRDPAVQNLCSLLLQLLFFANSFAPISFQTDHVPGVENGKADAISRPQKFPTWESIFEVYPELQPIPTYHVPSKLISMIRYCLSRNSIVELSEQRTTKLLLVELHTLRHSADNRVSRTYHSSPPLKPTPSASS